MVDQTTVATVVLAGLGAIVWAVRVEGRVNGHDKLFEEREKQVQSWLDQHEERDQERHTDLKTDLQDIKNAVYKALER